MDVTPSPQQRQAIEGPLGPALVVAGPGAGKTFCLINRIAHAIDRFGIDPARICAVTFTNKAAEEITVRLRQALGRRGEDITRGTLHSLCLAMLREHGDLLDLPRGFGIADEAYQQAALRRLGVPRRRASTLLTLFGRRRLQGYQLGEDEERLFHEYVAALRKKHVIDFDDIIQLTGRLVHEHPDATRALAARWDYVLVDEFQDLNDAQYRILRRLTQEHRRLFAVGDDEQSIFSWAGADPRVLRRFCDDFGIAEIVLDENRRCSRQIFAAARRLLAENPQLFDKRLEARRESPHPVRAVGFADEADEGGWLLRDMQDDRRAAALSWGDYAILYRQHRIGADLEKRLVRAGVPCRLARGQALMDDKVVGYTVASLRLMSAPDDPAALDAFAERTLSPHLLERVRAGASDQDLLAGLRAFARTHARGDPDTKKAWRFVYHVENLRALWNAHSSLGGLVEELLSQRVGAYRNPLEEQAEDLTDPAAYPGAAALAEDLREAVRTGRQIGIPACAGRGFALQQMLGKAGVPNATLIRPAAEPRASGPVLDDATVNDPRFPVRLFKALQLMQSDEFVDVFRDFVTFDLETTDKDVEACEIVEIGAVRVRDGTVVDRFRTLVRCDRSISAGATAIHGYRDADLASAPRLDEVWDRFRHFVGQDVLVAHNALDFDIPVLRRCAGHLDGVDGFVFYDTLPLARSLFRESASLEALVGRFGIDGGRSHHALDDALALAHVLVELSARRMARSRKSTLVQAMDYLGMALALRGIGQRLSDEEALLEQLARPHALGRFSDCLDAYAQHRETWPEPEAPPVAELVDRLGGQRLMAKLRAQRTASERYPAAAARIQTLVDGSHAPTLEESVGRFLERVTLSTSEGVEADPHRVNLLTLHSTKGLEFSRVYVVGVEDHHLPGCWPTAEQREDEIQEARRLLYVGMTRARDRLVLTRARRRFGRDAGGSRFLDEIGLEVEDASEQPELAGSDGPA